MKPQTFPDALKSLLRDVSDCAISSKRALILKLKCDFGNFRTIGNTTEKHTWVCLRGFTTRKNQPSYF